MSTKEHAPVVGAFTIAGTARCTCGWPTQTRWGSQARKALRKHLAKHNPKEGQPR